MNLIRALENTLEKNIDDETKKIISIYEKCLSLKSPMDYTDKVGSIEDINNIITYLLSKEDEVGQVYNLKKSISNIPSKKASLINFI